MTHTTYTPAREFLTRPLSFADVKARLALIEHRALARKWGIDHSSITNAINGKHPWSPLVPRLARHIKVPKDLLRSYFFELAAQQAEAQADQDSSAKGGK